MAESEIFFVTSTGTDIGKTFVIEKICEDLTKKKIRFDILKPVVTGFKKEDKNTDSARLLKILGKRITKNNLDEISPWRLKEALSPDIASELEHKKIDFLEIVSFCQKRIDLAISTKKQLFIEGSGGVMTPINNNKTFLDLMAALEIPVILVVGNYLGTISHSLSAVYVLNKSRVRISKIILNCKESDKMSFRDNLKSLKKFIPDTQIELFNRNYSSDKNVLDLI